MQVSFWSNYHQIGTTNNMIAVALFIALKYRLRILVAHNHFDRSTLESAFIDESYMEHSLMDFSDTGIDALSRFIKFNRIEKDEISSYTTTVLKNRLDLLIGTRNTNRNIYQNNLKETIRLILQSAALYYDLIFIDTAPGNNEISETIIKNSNLVVVNLCQNPNTIENYLKDYSDYREKSLIILGKYDVNSRFNIKKIKKRFCLNNVYAIPYSTEFADACIESRVVDFFIKNLEADRNDIHNNFITGVRETAESILSVLGIADTRTARQVN
ncbi:MAG: ParA family protein [Clostridiaceae bacterium]|nr:ParA family protein [Clostridiaceae bacterium]